jgi:hypothetical protein
MIEALEDFMAELASAGDVESFAARWEAEPAPFASVTVTSWEEYAGGGAEIAFAEGAKPSVAELEAAFGPFSEPPRMPSGTRVLRALWRREDMPVNVVLLVYSPPEAREPLDRIVVQRGI